MDFETIRLLKLQPLLPDCFEMCTYILATLLSSHGSADQYIAMVSGL